MVFLSIQEHHSNLLPWRESCADVVVIPEDGTHRLDLRVLEQQLIEHCDRPLKIGTFSAGSNLTGVLVMSSSKPLWFWPWFGLAVRVVFFFLFLPLELLRLFFFFFSLFVCVCVCACAHVCVRVVALAPLRQPHASCTVA